MKNLQSAYVSLKTQDFFPYALGIIWVAWLPFGLSSSVINLLSSHLTLPRFIAITTGAVLFVVIYLWGVWGNVRELTTTMPPLTYAKTSAWLTTAILAALSTVMTVWGGNDWAALFIFTCAYSAGSLPTAQAIWTVIALLLVTLIGGLHRGFSPSELGVALFIVGVVGTIVISMTRSFRTSQELRAAREEIARLAVTTERLRIARDLHDLLGHNLSLIALKSELARRLLEPKSERVIAEISDIEQTARKMLQEVREAVGSYRQPTLSSELRDAQEILAAAGIAYCYEGNEHILSNLPTIIEVAFAWTVREGVTNIIRHSRAHLCTIRTTYTQYKAILEIIDDGVGAVNHIQDILPTAGPGNGLRGLTERITALNGQFSAGPQINGGFCLTVSLPLLTKAEKPHIVTSS